MTIRYALRPAALLGALLLVSCGEPRTGPVVVSAIGEPPALANPNLEPIGPPTAFLLAATAQGLVRFDASGQIEPALAQSWIVSDDGRRYTFRLARTNWSTGEPVTAEQVVTRLDAAVSRASRNPLKPVLGAIDEIEAMTDTVLEISLVAPRVNFLQLLAQPELAILRNDAGTGPYAAAPRPDGSILISLPEEEDIAVEDRAPEIILRGEAAAVAVARFSEGLADAVIGGTLGDLPIAAASDPRASVFRFDPVAGLFGLAFADTDGPLADPAVRRALSMAIDRQALVTGIGVPELQPRQTLLPPGIAELPAPTEPDWGATPPTLRRTIAARTIAAIGGKTPLRVRVAMPPGLGYRIAFAYLGRDWTAIGVETERVAPGEDADLILIDAVAPATMASWYFRSLACGMERLCAEAAEPMLAAARSTADMAARQRLLAGVDRLLTEAAIFIPLTAPVRWSLISPRLTGFQPNSFAERAAGSLLAETQ